MGMTVTGSGVAKTLRELPARAVTQGKARRRAKRVGFQNLRSGCNPHFSRRELSFDTPQGRRLRNAHRFEAMVKTI
jgi:hypothetical protein